MRWCSEAPSKASHDAVPDATSVLALSNGPTMGPATSQAVHTIDTGVPATRAT